MSPRGDWDGCHMVSIPVDGAELCMADTISVKVKLPQNSEQTFST